MKIDAVVILLTLALVPKESIVVQTLMAPQFGLLRDMARIFQKFIEQRQEDELVHMCFWLAANISGEFDQAVVEFVS